eukprot:gene21414-28372_t
MADAGNAESDYRPSIHCWSGPRCCSTSLMTSFAQRSDTTVLDEPLYASYLKTTGHQRPYLDLVFKAQDSDGEKVVREQLLVPLPEGQYQYSKHIVSQESG